MNFSMVGRLSVLLAVLAFGLGLTHVVTPISDLIGIEDGLQFFLASLVFVTAWKPTVLFFTEHPLKLSRLLTLGISFWSASFMVAAVWAVRWRASDYSPYFSDDLLRYSFRYLALCGSLCALAAPEFFEQEISARRLTKIAVGLACIFVTVIVLVYGSRFEKAFRHDTSPTPNFVEGNP